MTRGWVSVDDGWGFWNPASERLLEADRRLRCGMGPLPMSPPPTQTDGLLMVSVAETLRWLLVDAPSQKAAVDKLVSMRKAIRDARSIPGGATGGATRGGTTK